jgi:hypothetical protein
MTPSSLGPRPASRTALLGPPRTVSTTTQKPFERISREASASLGIVHGPPLPTMGVRSPSPRPTTSQRCEDHNTRQKGGSCHGNRPFRERGTLPRAPRRGPVLQRQESGFSGDSRLNLERRPRAARRPRDGVFFALALRCIHASGFTFRFLSARRFPPVAMDCSSSSTVCEYRPGMPSQIPIPIPATAVTTRNTMETLTSSESGSPRPEVPDRSKE